MFLELDNAVITVCIFIISFHRFLAMLVQVNINHYVNLPSVFPISTDWLSSVFGHQFLERQVSDNRIQLRYVESKPSDRRTLLHLVQNSLMILLDVALSPKRRYFVQTAIQNQISPKLSTNYCFPSRISPFPHASHCRQLLLHVHVFSFLEMCNIRISTVLILQCQHTNHIPWLQAVQN
jgi:hypothetical protein